MKNFTYLSGIGFVIRLMDQEAIQVIRNKIMPK